VFQEIVLTGLEVVGDALKEPDYSDEDNLSLFSDRIRRMFSRGGLLKEVVSLLDAHSSEELFSISYYRFLMLHEIIENEVDTNNDYLADGSGGTYKGLSLGNIDFGAITDAYFQDTDFPTPPSIFEKIVSDKEVTMGSSEEAFGVIQRLKPHPDGLVMEEIDTPAGWGGYNLVYNPNEDYPYIPPELKEE